MFVDTKQSNICDAEDVFSGTIVRFESLCKIFNIAQSTRPYDKEKLKQYQDRVYAGAPHRIQLSHNKNFKNDNLIAISINQPLNGNFNYIPYLHMYFTNTAKGKGLLFGEDNSDHKVSLNGLHFEIEGHPIGNDRICVTLARINGIDMSSNWTAFTGEVTKEKAQLQTEHWSDKPRLYWNKIIKHINPITSHNPK